MTSSELSKTIGAALGVVGLYFMRHWIIAMILILGLSPLGNGTLSLVREELQAWRAERAEVRRLQLERDKDAAAQRKAEAEASRSALLEDARARLF